MDQSARKLDVLQRRAVISRVRELVKPSRVTRAILARSPISRNQAISPLPVWRTSLIAATMRRLFGER